MAAAAPGAHAHPPYERRDDRPRRARGDGHGRGRRRDDLDHPPVAEYTITGEGARWNNRTTSADPSPRAETPMAYDSDTRQVVLYGGNFIDPQPFSDTWLWDGSKWSLWQPAGGA